MSSQEYRIAERFGQEQVVTLYTTLVRYGNWKPDVFSIEQEPVRFLVLCVIWGSTWVASKAGIEAVPPLLFAATRFTAAGLLLLVYGRMRSEAAAAGGEAPVLPADIADAAAVDASAETVLRAWGKIDVWINNAMVTVFGAVESIRPDEFRRVTDVTYLGQVHGTQTALNTCAAPVEERSSVLDRR